MGFSYSSTCCSFSSLISKIQLVCIFLPIWFSVVKGCILDDERARLYAAVVNKGSAARFAFAAGVFGETLEALFWLQLPCALSHLMNKSAKRSPQKASVSASIPELGDASMLNRITSKGKSMLGSGKRDKIVSHFVCINDLCFDFFSTFYC